MTMSKLAASSPILEPGRGLKSTSKVLPGLLVLDAVEEEVLGVVLVTFDQHLGGEVFRK